MKAPQKIVKAKESVQAIKDKAIEVNKKDTGGWFFVISAGLLLFCFGKGFFTNGNIVQGQIISKADKVYEISIPNLNKTVNVLSSKVYAVGETVDLEQRETLNGEKEYTIKER